MYNELKQIAQDNGWGFLYGRPDYNNLFSEAEETEKLYLFVDPIATENEYGEYGELQGVTYSGRFMLVYSSELDEGYEERYLNDIKPIIEESTQTLTDALACKDLFIQSWKMTEIINIMDAGYDGVLVNYSVVDV
jgi:hypothetical protein